MQQPRNSKDAPAMDIISGLPDTILSRILSLLHTKEAVATSILSKRWIHLWHFIESIDFPYIIRLNNIESTYSFNQFMYSILVSRYAAGSHFTNRFCLEIQYGSPNLAYRLGFPNVIKWINLIVQPGLEYLRLRLPVYCLHVDHGDDDDDHHHHHHHHEYDILPKLPISILKCRTLVSLDLAQFRVEGFSFSSVGFGFPSLNQLHLNKIVFHEVRDFMLLLAGCPNLEYLQAEHIYVYCDEDSLTFQEFKSLSLPKLISADISRCWFSCFPVKTLSSSEHLCVETSMLCKKDHAVYEVNQPQWPCYDIPIFHNLTHLELHDTLELVPQVLKYCPKLQNLELYEEEHEEDGQEINWAEPEVVPQCLSSYLTNCTIHNFSGIQSEFKIAKYILKNARNLQMMEVWSTMDDQPEIERKLSMCPKASATCQLFIY